MYQIIADMHTHTIASTHAYSTLTEMVDAARERGLYAIAITDHGPKMPGAPRDWFFGSLNQIPLFFKGVKTVMGVEANILDFNGTLDIESGTQEENRQMDSLDWVVASIHGIRGIRLEKPTLEKSTELWLKVAQNPRVNVIGHSGSPAFAYDLDVVIPEFGRNHKLVEINAHTFDVRPSNVPYCRKIAEACMRYRVPIIVNSDAHFQTEVGEFRKALALLEEIGFPEELIVNASAERLNAYLTEFTNIDRNRSR